MFAMTSDGFRYFFTFRLGTETNGYPYGDTERGVRCLIKRFVVLQTVNINLS